MRLLRLMLIITVLSGAALSTLAQDLPDAVITADNAHRLKMVGTMGEDIFSVSHSPDGRWIAYFNDEAVVVLDAVTGEPVFELDFGHYLSYVNFSIVNDRLIVSTGPSIEVFHLPTGELLVSIYRELGDGNGMDAALSHDGSTLLVNDYLPMEGWEVGWYDVDTNTRLAGVDVATGIYGEFSIVANPTYPMVFLQKDDSTGIDGPLFLYSTTDATLLYTFPDGYMEGGFSTSGRYAIVGGHSGIEIWNVTQMPPRLELHATQAINGKHAISRIFSPQDDLIVFTTRNNEIGFYRMNDQSLEIPIHYPPNVHLTSIALAPLPTQDIMAVTYYHAENAFLDIFGTTTGERIVHLQIPNGRPRLTFSPDGTRLYTNTADNIQVWMVDDRLWEWQTTLRRRG